MVVFILLITLSPIAYYGYGRFEQWRIRRAAFEKLTSFADRIMDHMRQKNLYELQSSFSPDIVKKLSLEDIAVFITTLEIDKSRDEVWSDSNESDGNVSLSGILRIDDKQSYPLRLMMIKRPEGITLRWIEVTAGD